MLPVVAPAARWRGRSSPTPGRPSLCSLLLWPVAGTGLFYPVAAAVLGRRAWSRCTACWPGPAGRRPGRPAADAVLPLVQRLPGAAVPGRRHRPAPGLTPAPPLTRSSGQWGRRDARTAGQSGGAVIGHLTPIFRSEESSWRSYGRKIRGAVIGDPTPIFRSESRGDARTPEKIRGAVIGPLTPIFRRGSRWGARGTGRSVGQSAGPAGAAEHPGQLVDDDLARGAGSQRT